MRVLVLLLVVLATAEANFVRNVFSTLSSFNPFLARDDRHHRSTMARKKKRKPRNFKPEYHPAEVLVSYDPRPDSDTLFDEIEDEVFNYENYQEDGQFEAVTNIAQESDEKKILPNSYDSKPFYETSKEYTDYGYKPEQINSQKLQDDYFPDKFDDYNQVKTEEPEDFQGVLWGSLNQPRQTSGWSPQTSSFSSLPHDPLPSLPQTSSFSSLPHDPLPSLPQSSSFSSLPSLPHQKWQRQAPKYQPQQRRKKQANVFQEPPISYFFTLDDAISQPQDDWSKRSDTINIMEDIPDKKYAGEEKESNHDFLSTVKEIKSENITGKRLVKKRKPVGKEWRGGRSVKSGLPRPNDRAPPPSGRGEDVKEGPEKPGLQARDLSLRPLGVRSPGGGPPPRPHGPRPGFGVNGPR